MLLVACTIALACIHTCSSIDQRAMHASCASSNING
jgi:hypothetical protein